MEPPDCYWGTVGGLGRDCAAENCINPADKAQVYIPVLPNIQIGEKDIIVKGICTKEIEKSSKEIPEGLYVTTVETFDYGGLRHWRVTAR